MFYNSNSDINAAANRSVIFMTKSLMSDERKSRRWAVESAAYL